VPRRKALVLRSSGGDVTVHLRKGPLTLDGKECLGYYDPDTREIVIDRRLRGDARARVIWHEWGHAATLDRGVDIPDPAIEEAVCDAIADAMLALVGSPAATVPPKT
jgi:hypothetical protein